MQEDTMAGKFKLIDYEKEGPGVYLDQPEAGPVKTFFGILGRKFWKIMQINILYVALSLPIIAIAILIGAYIFPQMFSFMQYDKLQAMMTSIGATLAEDATSGFNAEETASLFLLQMTVILGVALVGIQLVVFGPVHAGITYIFRNYSREEHAFIWSDFKEQAKLNWKQSTVACIIGIVGFVVLGINIWFYSNGKIFDNAIINSILTAAFVIMMILLIMIQTYVYPMMITFKLNIKQLYKNAFLFTMAKLPGNLGMLLITLVFSLVIPFLINAFLGTIGLFISLFYYLFIGFGFTLLLTNFFVYRQMKKYMIDPMMAKENEEAGETARNNADEEAIFKDVKPDKIDRRR